MKFAVLVILGLSVAACQTAGGPYGSAVYPSGYGTVHKDAYKCGPDIHVCYYENRDRLYRGQQ